MQSPPPPPPPPAGQPPMMSPGYGGAMPAPGNLASPGMRIVGGLIDVVVLIVINTIVSRIVFQGNVPGLSGLINLAIDLLYGVLDPRVRPR